MPTAVVTGAAGGLGRAIASHLAVEGYRLHLVDVAELDALARDLNGVAHRIDVRVPEQVAALAGIDPVAEVVCLNAGIVGPTLGAPWEVPPAEWEHVIGVNLMGVVNGLRVLVPRLLTADRPRRVLITASLAGLVTFPGGGAYAASKHALVAVAEQTAMALHASGVSVTLLCPALVRTGMSEIGEDPADVAAEALIAMRAGRFLVTPPQWRQALTTRTNQLLGGVVPDVPAPSAAYS